MRPGGAPQGPPAPPARAAERQLADAPPPPTEAPARARRMEAYSGDYFGAGVERRHRSDALHL